MEALTRPPFEPLATTDLRLLSWKTAFLVAITLARRASELCALRIDPPYLNFHKEKVVLHTDLVFLLKVVSPFHINQDIILPAFFPTPSTPIERLLHFLNDSLAYANRKLETVPGEKVLRDTKEERDQQNRLKEIDQQLKNLEETFDALLLPLVPTEGDLPTHCWEECKKCNLKGTLIK
ncbi:Fibrous sheath-interacting protein 1 [Varanus komodoensis]|nr:Fibrous sheath-interacting protein 1 [Varanus komodoensis]